jgi:hypothetical protein
VPSPRGASNETSQALELLTIEELAQAMLVDGLSSRIQASDSSQRDYVRFGAGLLTHYQLDEAIAKRLRIPPRAERRQPEDAVLSHFDVHPGFRFARAGWTADKTRTFIAFAQAIHEAGLDWYFVDIAPYQLRAGNKPIGRDAVEVLIIVEGSSALVRLSKHAPDALRRTIGKVTVLDDPLVTLAVERRPLLAARSNAERAAGLWPDQYPTETGKSAATLPPQTVYPMTTNLVLYRPPGSGKTYATAHEAVRLKSSFAIERRSVRTFKIARCHF